MADRREKIGTTEREETRSDLTGGEKGGLTTFPAGFDRLIHERIRLGIVSALAAGGSLSFNHLKGLLETTDGNLSVHARKLEEAGYIECLKSFDNRTPRTDYRITAAGRRALSDYLDQMEQIIRIARS